MPKFIISDACAKSFRSPLFSKMDLSSLPASVRIS